MWCRTHVKLSSDGQVVVFVLETPTHSGEVSFWGGASENVHDSFRLQGDRASTDHSPNWRPFGAVSFLGWHVHTQKLAR